MHENHFLAQEITDITPDDLEYLIVAQVPRHDLTIYFPPAHTPLAIRQAWVNIMKSLSKIERISITMSIAMQIQKRAGILGTEPPDLWRKKMHDAVCSITSYQDLIKDIMSNLDRGQQQRQDIHPSVEETATKIRDGYAELLQALVVHQIP